MYARSMTMQVWITLCDEWRHLINYVDCKWQIQHLQCGILSNKFLDLTIQKYKGLFYICGDILKEKHEITVCMASMSDSWNDVGLSTRPIYKLTWIDNYTLWVAVILTYTGFLTGSCLTMQRK